MLVDTRALPRRGERAYSLRREERLRRVRAHSSGPGDASGRRVAGKGVERPSMGMFDTLRDELVSISRVTSVSMVDVMALPDPLRRVMTGFLRSGPFTVRDLRTELGLDGAQAEELAGLLLEKGYLRIEPGAVGRDITYRISLGRTRGRNVPLSL